VSANPAVRLVGRSDERPGELASLRNAQSVFTDVHGWRLARAAVIDPAVGQLDRNELDACGLTKNPWKTAFWQTTIETPRSTPPQSSRANGRIQKIETTAS
jgi:hypothetical protein